MNPLMPSNTPLHLRAKAGESQLVADSVCDANSLALGSVKLRADVVFNRVEGVCRLALRSLPVAFHRGLQSASRRAADGFRGVHVVLHGLTDVREGRLRVAREVVPPVRHGIDRALREVP